MIQINHYLFIAAGGDSVSTLVRSGSFVGALLFDDVFNGLSLLTVDPGCNCATNYAIDNLAVAAVPEPATALLLLAGAGLVAWRRRR